MAVYAQDCQKDLDPYETYETFILNVTKILREGRRAGAKEFSFTGDLNVELGILCTDEDDIGEGTLCCQQGENDHGGFRKLMRYGIVKEFNCKVTSTWSNCGREKRRGLDAATIWGKS